MAGDGAPEGRRLNYFDLPKPVRVTTLRALREQGLTWPQVSAAVGASESAVHRDWRWGKDELSRPRSRRRIWLMMQLEDGLCRQSPDGFVDSPLLDRAKTITTRALCEDCPLTGPCLELVDPQASYFDGVCAGRVWLDGRDVTEDYLRQAC